MDPEPPQPNWLVQSNLLTAAAALLQGESSGEHTGSANSSEAGAANLLHDLVNSLDDILPEVSPTIISYFYGTNSFW